MRPRGTRLAADDLRIDDTNCVLAATPTSAANTSLGGNLAVARWAIPGVVPAGASTLRARARDPTVSASRWVTRKCWVSPVRTGSSTGPGTTMKRLVVDAEGAAPLAPGEGVHPAVALDEGPTLVVTIVIPSGSCGSRRAGVGVGGAWVAMVDAGDQVGQVGGGELTPEWSGVLVVADLELAEASYHCAQVSEVVG